jgi:hypothetical protein
LAFRNGGLRVFLNLVHPLTELIEGDVKTRLLVVLEEDSAAKMNLCRASYFFAFLGMASVIS